MRLPRLLAATAVAGLVGAPAFADTLVLNDGTRMHGTLVTMNRQTVVFDAFRALFNVGSRIPIMMAIIPMTTRSSTSVKPRRRLVNLLHMTGLRTDYK